MKITINVIAFFIFAFFVLGTAHANQLNNAASDSVKSHKKENTGIGPVKEIKLGPINKAMVKEGKNIFNSKCFACHRLDTRLVGPALTPIVKKTNAVYLMNYLLNTTEMQKKEPELKKLIKEYNGVVMPDQYLNKKQAREVLEFLRYKAEKK